MYTVYVLRSLKDGRTYIGCTKDIETGEILEVMRDEVWGEGQVEEFEGNWDGHNPRRGLRLISNPYPVVVLRGEGGRLAAALEESRTSFEVYVTPDYQHRPTEIHVGDNKVFNVEDGSKVSVAQAVRDHGLVRGLRRAALLDSRSACMLSPGIHPTREAALDRFNDIILAHVDHRRQYGSLPGRIRNWAEAIVDELPSSLRDTGVVTPHQLRNCIQ